MEGRGCLVTGGGGFVGKALVKELIRSGAEVRSLSRGSYPELEELGVECFQHDLGSAEEIPEQALEDIDTVFHTAALVKMWGRYDDFYNVNVRGTEKLLSAAKAAGVKTFIFTSSPSVIANGKDLKNVDETIPYPEEYEAYYPETKAIAEQRVLSENSDEFYTCSLRPHLIFGPGDTNMIPTVIEKLKSGSLKKIGAGENLVDFSYIDDCVAAHIKSAEALLNEPSARGRSYFISQGDPYPLWQWIDKVAAANNLPPVTGSVSPKVALTLAGVFEKLSTIFPFLGEPRLTRFLVSEMCTDHYFDISNAKRFLGFTPSLTVEEGLAKTFTT